MTVTMWEAVAAPGRSADLLGWLRTCAPPGARLYASTDDRVVVLAPAPLRLPGVPDDLLARPPHAWDFKDVTAV